MLLGKNSPPDKQETSYTNVIGIVTDTSGTAVLQTWQTEIEDYSDTSFVVTAIESFTKKYNGVFSEAYQWGVNSEKNNFAVISKDDVIENDDGTATLKEGNTYYIRTSEKDESSYDGKRYDEIPAADVQVEITASGLTTSVNGKQTDIYIRAGIIPVDGWSSVEVTVGGIYAFAFDKNDQLMFMVGLGYSSDLPTLPDEEEQQEEKQAQSGSGQEKPSGDMPGGMSGGMSGGGGTGMSGGAAAQEEKTPYSTEGTTILSVTPQETVSVTITIDELDILNVHAGQEAQVTLDALPGQAFTGVITKVNTIASNEGGNSKYSADVELKRSAYMLGGMNASANITVEERENVLLIPSEALTEQDGKTAVYTAYDSKTETLSGAVTVETGLSDGKQVQILSGLQEGETVWYSYYDTLEIKGFPGNI